MAKKDEFKPGLYNFYLVQAPRRDDETVQTLGIHITSGKKRDGFRNIPFTITGTARFAALGQHECQTQDALTEWHKRYHNHWVKPYDVSPLKESTPTT